MIDYGVDIPTKLECLPNTMFVEQIEYGERTTNWGFTIQAERMDADGRFVRPRWAKVLFKADNIVNVDIGDYVLMEHGQWARGFEATIEGQDKKIWYVAPKAYKTLIAVSKDKPSHMEEYGH